MGPRSAKKRLVRRVAVSVVLICNPDGSHGGRFTSVKPELTPEPGQQLIIVTLLAIINRLQEPVAHFLGACSNDGDCCVLVNIAHVSNLAELILVVILHDAKRIDPKVPNS